MAIFGKLGRYNNFGLLIMRIGLGAMMMVHGIPKIAGGFDKWAELGHAMSNLHIHFWPTFWGFMCAITEAVGGLFCILGLWFQASLHIARHQLYSCVNGTSHVTRQNTRGIACHRACFCIFRINVF